VTTRAKIVIGVLVVLIGGAVVGANIYYQRDRGVQVATEAIRARDLEAIVSASGKIQPKRQVNISANTMGKVTRLAVEEGQRVKSGQFLLPVDAASDSPDMLFEQAQSAEEADDKPAAERLYRRVMKLDPGDPAAAFNLGNLLRLSGRGAEAEAAFRAATKADPGYADAWYNLADLLDEQGRTADAIGCLKRALASDAAYADAMFNLALLLQRVGNHAEAAAWWRQYLTLDHASPWASRAKRALKYCEMQMVRP